MKKSFFLLLLAVALFSCNQPTNNSIKVISYNIRLGVADDGNNSWANRRPATIAMLRAEAPDVFGVQEAYDFQNQYILASLPQYQCVGVGRDDGSNEGEHMSIFFDTTRIELQQWGTYWLSETPDQPSLGWDAACRRTATWALLLHLPSNHPFFLVNTHLDHVGKEARKNGLAIVLQRIRQINPDNYPLILTGDFNVLPNDSSLADLAGIMHNARYAATLSDQQGSWHNWGQTSEEIDYIWYSGFSECPSFHVLSSPYDSIPFISDHYPIAAILKF